MQQLHRMHERGKQAPSGMDADVHATTTAAELA